MHLILGTAGHVDHGKTSLIQALTGHNCDTAPQEKQRGITINLGFTYFDINKNLSIGIVDVPGHKDFINNMIAGASAINICILVIAANEGVMPQTIEHLKIMQLLNIKHGFIALSKFDLINNNQLLDLKKDISNLCKNTFLQGCKVIPFSSKTGFGIIDIKNNITTLAKFFSNQANSNTSFFRMYIDRLFTLNGIGKVVTGSALSGSLTTNSKLHILPSGKQINFKGIQKHGKQCNSIIAGDRTSININSKPACKKGNQLCTKIIPQTKLIDAVFYNFSNKEINLWSQVLYLSGSFKTYAKLHLINTNKLAPNNKAIVQISLNNCNCHVIFDRFIIRNSSNNTTLGGGYIFSTSPNIHKRRPKKLIDALTIKSNLTGFNLVLNFLKTIPLTIEEIIIKFNFAYSFILKNLNHNSSIISLKTNSQTYYFNKNSFKNLQNKYTNNTISQITNSLPVPLKPFAKFFFTSKNNTTNLANYSNKILTLTNNLNQNLFTLTQLCNLSNLNKNSVYSQLKQLVTNNTFIKIDDFYIKTAYIQSCKNVLLTFLKSNNLGITVSQFKNLLNTNRKTALALFAYFEKEKIVIRQQNVRILTTKGKKLLS